MKRLKTFRVPLANGISGVSSLSLSNLPNKSGLVSDLLLSEEEGQSMASPHIPHHQGDQQDVRCRPDGRPSLLCSIPFQRLGKTIANFQNRFRNQKLKNPNLKQECWITSEEERGRSGGRKRKNSEKLELRIERVPSARDRSEAEEDNFSNHEDSVVTSETAPVNSVLLSGNISSHPTERNSSPLGDIYILPPSMLSNPTFCEISNPSSTMYSLSPTNISGPVTDEEDFFDHDAVETSDKDEASTPVELRGRKIRLNASHPLSDDISGQPTRDISSHPPDTESSPLRNISFLPSSMLFDSPSRKISNLSNVSGPAADEDIFDFSDHDDAVETSYKDLGSTPVGPRGSNARFPSSDISKLPPSTRSPVELQCNVTPQDKELPDVEERMDKEEFHRRVSQMAADLCLQLERRRNVSESRNFVKNKNKTKETKKTLKKLSFHEKCNKSKKLFSDHIKEDLLRELYNIVQHSRQQSTESWQRDML